MIGLYSANSQSGVGFTGLLDEYGEAAAAYSVRRLSSTYTDSLIEVRRSSDNALQDIGFNANGDLDTSALTTFVGAGDGFVRTWYDQSGNANDSIQTTTSAQPQIVSSGSVILDNSKAAIDILNNTELRSSTVSTESQPITRIAVGNFNVIGSQSHLLDGIVQRGALGSTTSGWRIFAGSVSDYTTPASINTQYLMFATYNGASSELSINGSGLGTKSIGTRGFDGVIIGNNPAGSAQFIGKVQSVIIYSSDQSTNRTSIESNINTYFSIY